MLSDRKTVNVFFYSSLYLRTAFCGSVNSNREKSSNLSPTNTMNMYIQINAYIYWAYNFVNVCVIKQHFYGIFFGVSCRIFVTAVSVWP